MISLYFGLVFVGVIIGLVQLFGEIVTLWLFIFVGVFVLLITLLCLFCLILKV